MGVKCVRGLSLFFKFGTLLMVTLLPIYTKEVDSTSAHSAQ